MSRTTGTSVPTITYSPRHALVPTGPHQADDGDTGAHRLGLIRELMDVGGLGAAAVRHPLDGLGDGRLSLHEVMGRARYALGPRPGAPGPQEHHCSLRRPPG